MKHSNTEITSFIHDGQEVKLHYHNGQLVWAKTYIISYNANGGSGAPANQTKTHGTDLILSSATPTKPASTTYTFLGWGTSTTDTTVDYNAGATYSKDEDASLYAIWCQHKNTYKTTNMATCEYKRICTVCSTVTAEGTDHGDYLYTNWNYSSDTHHCRNKICTRCNNYRVTEFAEHAWNYGNWTQYSDSQHCRTKTCSESKCAFTTTEYEDHNFTEEPVSNGTKYTCATCGYNYIAYDLATYNVVFVYKDSNGNNKTYTCQAIAGGRATLPSDYDQRSYYQFATWNSSAAASPNPNNINCDVQFTAIYNAALDVTLEWSGAPSTLTRANTLRYVDNGVEKTFAVNKNVSSNSRITFRLGYFAANHTINIKSLECNDFSMWFDTSYTTTSSPYSWSIKLS